MDELEHAKKKKVVKMSTFWDDPPQLWKFTTFFFSNESFPYYYFLDANIRESNKVKSPAFSFGLKTKPDPNPVSPSPNTYNTSGITTKGRLITIRIIFYKLHILQEKIVQCPPVFISKSRIQRSLLLHIQEPTIPNLPAKKQQLQPLFILLEWSLQQNRLRIVQV